MPPLHTHVPVGLWYGISAAVALIFVLAVTGLRRTAPQEGGRRVFAGLAAWLAVAVTLGALGAFATTYHRPALVLAAGITLPILVGLVLMSRPGALSRVLESIPVRSLIAVQLYRVLGGVFLIGWAAGRIPAIFALPAGVGDIAVGVAAPFVAARLADGSERSRRLAVLWNLTGLGDLVVAVALGAATSPTTLWPTLLGHPNPLISRLPYVLIPVFVVPLSVLLHVGTLRRLSEAGEERERPVAMSSTVPSPRGSLTVRG